MPETQTLRVYGTRSLEALASKQGELRDRLVKFESTIDSARVDEDVVRMTVGTLEFHHAVLAFSEAVHEMGIRTVGEACLRMDEVIALASSIAGMNIAETFSENAELVPESIRKRVPHASEPAAVPMPTLLRYAASLVAVCPIDALQAHAAAAGLVELGHRCRKAYEALQAFVRRNDPAQDESTRTVGRAYADGRLSLAEVAKALKLDVSDAIALLETQGFCRHAERLRMPDDERTRALARLRSDRQQRDGKPVPSRDRVVRDVIATQRIESVDVRPWLRSENR